jgi:hypothetical protein
MADEINEMVQPLAIKQFPLDEVLSPGMPVTYCDYISFVSTSKGMVIFSAFQIDFPTSVQEARDQGIERLKAHCVARFILTRDTAKKFADALAAHLRDTAEDQPTLAGYKKP